jgi:5,10-methylenetetrahydromethanopterin reductase
MDRVGLYFVEKTPLKDEIAYAKLAEEKGFDSIWQGQSRMSRDAIVPLTAIATVTNRIKVGTGVIHALTRNIAIIAVVFATLNELSNGRAMLGMGALWEPMASKIGVDSSTPLTAIREYVVNLRRIFNGETVTFAGKYVNLKEVKLEKSSGRVPVYVGATGFKMIELAGEIADGVLLNYMVSTSYNKQAIEHLKVGARKAGRSIDEIDRPQLVACSLDEDADRALDNARPLVTEYLGIEPHIGKKSGVKEDLLREIKEALGGWPPVPGGLEKALPLVDDKTVQLLTVSGTARDCRGKVKEYVEAGCTCPLLCPLGENVQEMIEAFSED